MDDTLSTEINCPMEAWLTLIVCHPIRQSPLTHPLGVHGDFVQLCRVGCATRSKQSSQRWMWLEGIGGGSH